MKKKKNYGILILYMFAFMLLSCTQDGDFKVPNIVVEEPKIKPNSTVLAIKTALQQKFNSNGDLIYTFFENTDNPTYIEAFVVSSDAAGNFYKKLIIQDKPEAPTAGIEVIVNNPSLSETYEVGRKIYIKLDGLSVSYDDGGNNTNANRYDDIDPTNTIPGKYVLGILDGGMVDDIPSASIKHHIWRSATVVDIIPNPIKLENIKGTHINTMVKISSSQMIKSDLTKTFAGEANDEFDGFRTIFECDTEATIQLQTSTYSSFKSNLLPSGKGEISAVLSKDFRAEFLIAIANTPSDLNFTDTDRCDPVVLNCGDNIVGGNINLLDENFNTIKSTDDLTAAGWTNINVNDGNVVYTSVKFSTNRYLEISAYGSEESPVEVWLVSPEIDLDSSIDEELTFETNTGYDNGKALTTYISLDFNGDVTTATWQRLDPILSEGTSSGFNRFTSSGSINISCLTGKAHVAFKYKGADGGVTTTFQIDNVKVTGN